MARVCSTTMVISPKVNVCPSLAMITSYSGGHSGRRQWVPRLLESVRCHSQVRMKVRFKDVFDRCLFFWPVQCRASLRARIDDGDLPLAFDIIGALCQAAGVNLFYSHFYCRLVWWAIFWSIAEISCSLMYCIQAVKLLKKRMSSMRSVSPCRWNRSRRGL